MARKTASTSKSASRKASSHETAGRTYPEKTAAAKPPRSKTSGAFEQFVEAATSGTVREHREAARNMMNATRHGYK
ncbi:MAG: hypothetical protein AAGJ11_03545 [Bacteroidota bacterium]